MKNKAINAQLLKKIVQEAGLCLQIPCENSQALTKWIALAGEPIWLEDKKALCLGDGKTPAEQLRALGTSLESFAPGESAPWLARRLWKELQSSARLYELIFKLLPVQIHSEFIAQKPANFSFLQGEALQSKDLAAPYWKTYPDARAVFWRNFDHDSQRDAQAKRFDGHRQKDAFQNHKHPLQAFSSSRLAVKANLKGSLFCNQGQNVPWPAHAKKFNSQFPVRSSSETRPINACILALMRTGS